MSAIQPPRSDDEFAGYAGFDEEDEGRRGTRRAMRYAIPVAVAAIAAGSIGLGTALATTGGGPDLPGITAAQLVAKMAAARTDTGSGTIRVTTDFGLPSGLLNAAASQAAGTGAAPADPRTRLPQLLTGDHTLTVAADGPTRERLDVDGSQYRVVRDGTQMWAYDAAGHSAVHATGLTAAAQPQGDAPVTPAQAAGQVLKALSPTTAVTVDGTAEVAGRAAYELVLTPKQTGSTIGSVRVAVDAAKGVPLSFSVLPASGGDPVVDIAWTRISFARPAASTFAFTPPHGTHVTQAPHGTAHHPAAHRPSGVPALPGAAGDAAKVIGKGWSAIAELHVPQGRTNGHKAPSVPEGLAGSFGKPVKGAFGSGTVISTRVVNVLITDRGGVYAGAVTPSALVAAADRG